MSGGVPSPPPPPPDPLPVRVRYVRGEGFYSYIRRLSAANHVEFTDVEAGVLRQGHVFSRGRDSEDRRQLWRDLGGLHSSAFTEVVADEGMTLQLPLCAKCSAGQHAVGRLVSVGNVCLRHRQWVDFSGQVNVSAVPAFAAAERTFRRVLVPRGVRVDQLAFRVCQGVSDCLPDGVVRARSERIGHREEQRVLLGYPETVAVATVMTDPGFLDQVFAPEPPARRRELLDDAVASAVSPLSLVEPWKVLNGLWREVSRDYEHISSARLRGVAPDPDGATLVAFWTSRPRWERS